MFSFSKIFSRSRRSPYASGVNKGDHDNTGGSTVSLPNLQSYTSQSKPFRTDESISPQPLNSRFDPDAPLGIFAQNSPRKNGVHNRPKTFYRLLDSDIASCSEMSSPDGLSIENGPSPVALPHKALALLGIAEASGFGTPPSPRPWENDLYDEFADDEWGLPSDEPLYPPSDRPPERVYFRPESLCSSFSTASEKTIATTLTSMTATSPSTGCPEDNGTFHSGSTMRETSMLNLEDTDDEAGMDVIVSKKGAARLPLEIALQICEYFIMETHREDLDQIERYIRCPNCDIYALWSLSLVSRSWNKAVNQLLYRYISLDFGYYSAPTRGQNGEGIAPEFIPYTSCCDEGKPLHTKIDVDAKLQLLYRTIWDSQDDIGERIRGIKLPRRLFSITKYPLSAILQKCPNLEFVDHAVTSGSAEDLVSILSKLTQMRRWTWKREQGVKYEQIKVRQRRMTAMVESKISMNGPPPVIALQVLPSWTKLQHLELNNLRRMEIPDEFDFCALPSLESVTLRNLCSVDRNAETRILERLPALQCLQIDTCLFISAEFIVSYLEQKGSKMAHLEIHNSVVPIHMLYQLLANTPLIVKFSVSNCPPTQPFSNQLPYAPIGFIPSLPRLPNLKHVNINMWPLRESFAFLLYLAENRERISKLKTMRMGFDAAGKEPQLGRGSCAMDGIEMRMEVRLRTECLFNNVQLIFSE